MGKANFKYTLPEIETTVKKWTSGGAYVSVPSKWAYKRVKVTLLEDIKEDEKEDEEK